MSHKTNDDTRQAPITEEDIREYQLIRPYIARCLSLNHDINNPLAGILGYSEFLKMDSSQLTDEQNAHLDQVITCAERIKKMMEQLCEAKLKLAKEIDLHQLGVKHSD